jgi:hypothetical protein
MTFDEWYDTVAKYVHPQDLHQWMSEAWDAAKKDEETLDEDDDDVVNYIVIEEDSNGNITWDSSYETIDEFFEVLKIVAEEAQEPVVISVPLH